MEGEGGLKEVSRNHCSVLMFIESVCVESDV